MRRSWLLWPCFLLSMAVVAAAMAWVTLTVIRLDRAEAAARSQAALEEKVRLALWRADSVAASLVTQESLVPWTAYRSALPATRSGTTAGIPPPAAAMPYVLARFQFGPKETPASQAKMAANPPVLVQQSPGSSAVVQLASVNSPAGRKQLLSLLPLHVAEAIPATSRGNIAWNNPLSQNQFSQRPRRGDGQSITQSPSQVEFDLRNSVIANNYFNNGAVLQSNQTLLATGGNNSDKPIPATDFIGVPMTPVWLEGQLLLARRISVTGREYVQGCLLDWPGIRAMLLDTIGDLLPGAELEPVTPGVEIDPARMLAALPLRLTPGDPPATAEDGPSPLVLSLAVAWLGIVLAAAAVAGLLAGAIRLSRRRASFVHAVTHELRTPLTTFQMYLEMLAEGMVADADQQRQYLRTLRAEAVRITHMVENVLSFARLERGRADGRVEAIRLSQLIDQVQGRLVQRAEQADMDLVVEGDPAAGQCVVNVNVSAVEQILYNLVDNACKYAAGAADKRIHLGLRVLPDRAELSVRDHGPGLAPARRRNWFRGFSKSAQEAAQTAPGIGLGLHLSRRLARQMGGDLQARAIDSEGAARPPESEGACFVLTVLVTK